MADVFRPSYQTTPPADAHYFTKKGVRMARFRLTKSDRQVEGRVMPNGKVTVRTEVYYALIRRDGKARRVSLGVSDMSAARQLAAKHQLHADHHKAGLLDPFAGHRNRPLIGTMTQLQKRACEYDRNGRVVVWGADLMRADVAKAIEGSHLQDYRTSLEAGGRCVQHIEETIRSIRRVCIPCGFRTTDDLDPTRLNTHLAKLIRGGHSYNNRNGYLKSLRAFVRYLLREDRIAKDPFQTVQMLNVEADPKGKRKRRDLTADEFAALLLAAEKSGTLDGVDGEQRSLLYLTAISSGLRKSELAKLQVGNLSLASDPPYVDPPGWSTKAKRNDGPIPLHDSVAARLRVHVTTRKPADKVFDLYTAAGRLRRTNYMMKRDCETAGIPYCDEFEGTCDFHGLRVGFVAAICRIVDLSQACSMARHSSPTLTAKVYDRVRLGQKATAINQIVLPAPKATA